jgi:HPt (histidine-containing phosphotransfer) domain-containing protein
MLSAKGHAMSRLLNLQSYGVTAKPADEGALNLNEITRSTGLEARDAIDLLQLFYHVTVADLHRMREGLCTGNLQQVYVSAHSIKGAAMNLSLYHLAQAAASVEVSAKAGAADQVSLSIELLKLRFEPLRALLEHR